MKWTTSPIFNRILFSSAPAPRPGSLVLSDLTFIGNTRAGKSGPEELPRVIPLSPPLVADMKKAVIHIWQRRAPGPCEIALRMLRVRRANRVGRLSREFAKL